MSVLVTVARVAPSDLFRILGFPVEQLGGLDSLNTGTLMGLVAAAWFSVLGSLVYVKKLFSVPAGS